MTGNNNVVKNFLNNKPIKDDETALIGAKIIASIGYFNVDPKELRQIDYTKIAYDSNSFTKMIDLVRPDLSATQRQISKLCHIRLFELVSLFFNKLLFNEIAILVALSIAIILSLGYLLYSYIATNPISWVIVASVYIACYLIGLIAALITTAIRK